MARHEEDQMASKLFSGLNFYVVSDSLASYKEDLQDLVIAAGRTILKSKEELIAEIREGAAPTLRPFVEYDIDLLEVCRLREEVAILFQRLSEAEDMKAFLPKKKGGQDIASQTGSNVIGHTWLLESIAGRKLQPFFFS